MTGELIQTAHTYDEGRISLNYAFSAEATFNAFSAQTMYSGTTNLYDIFAGVNNMTFVQTGTNTYTGGTPHAPTVNISGASLYDFSASGSVLFYSMSATSISGQTIYSGNTELGNLLSGLFAPITVTNDVTRIQPGTNTYTGGTDLLPTVNISGISLDNIAVSGNATFESITATTLSAETINVFSQYIFNNIHVLSTTSNSSDLAIGNTTLSPLNSYNVKVGTAAGNSASAGGQSVFLGYGAGASIASCSGSIFIGYASGYNAQPGNNNVAIGAAAGQYLGSNNCIAIGSNAGWINSGASNTFIGTSCAYKNEDGSYNVFVGENSGEDNVDGSYNTFIGYQAGFSATTDNNVYIGYRAGHSSTGNSCVFIGANSGYYEVRTNSLHIANTNTKTLISGDFSYNRVGINLNPSALTQTFNMYNDKDALIRINNSSTSSNGLDIGVLETGPTIIKNNDSRNLLIATNSINKISIGTGKTMTNSAYTEVFRVSLATSTMAALSFNFGVNASDGSDFQVSNGIAMYSFICNGGDVITWDVKSTSASTLGTSGTLDVHFSADTLTPNVAKIMVKPISSLTTTQLKMYYTIQNTSDQATTIM